MRRPDAARPGFGARAAVTSKVHFSKWGWRRGRSQTREGAGAARRWVVLRSGDELCHVCAVSGRPAAWIARGAASLAGDRALSTRASHSLRGAARLAGDPGRKLPKKTSQARRRGSSSCGVQLSHSILLFRCLVYIWASPSSFVCCRNIPGGPRARSGQRKMASAQRSVRAVLALICIALCAQASLASQVRGRRRAQLWALLGGPRAALQAAKAAFNLSGPSMPQNTAGEAASGAAQAWCAQACLGNSDRRSPCPSLRQQHARAPAHGCQRSCRSVTRRACPRGGTRRRGRPRPQAGAQAGCRAGAQAGCQAGRPPRPPGAQRGRHGCPRTCHPHPDGDW
jgi:hypothetical protein